MAYSADAAIKWALSQVGSQAYNGYCQKFVMTAISKVTGKYVSTGNATNAWKMYGVSTSKTNVPTGAAVFFNGSNPSVGHVGLYIGNGYMVHATRSGVKKVKFSPGSSYRGWGWEQNAVLSSSGTYVGSTADAQITVVGVPQEVQIFHAESPKNIQRWGTLRYFQSVDNPSIGADMAKKLLQIYNRKKRSLKVTDCFGDSTVRAGTLIPVQLDIGDQYINNYMMVEKVTHKFSNGGHTMDLTLEGVWEDD